MGQMEIGDRLPDRGIAKPGRSATARGPDSLLDPDGIARNYLGLHRQHRSGWSWESLRPWTETF
jgi:hypothetical protein